VGKRALSVGRYIDDFVAITYDWRTCGIIRNNGFQQKEQMATTKRQKAKGEAAERAVFVGTYRKGWLEELENQIAVCQPSEVVRMGSL
jgi:hypothetical protein